MRTLVRIGVTLMLAMFVAALGIACTDDGDGDSPAPTPVATQASPAEAPATSDAAISIDEATVEDGRINVRVDVTGVTLDGTKIGLPAADNPDVAHWHVYVDGEYAGLSVSDVVSLPNDAITTISAGTHEVSVQLHNTDHTPVQPEVTDSTTVDVAEELTYVNAAGEPSIAIEPPQDGATSDGRLEVRVDVSGLTLDGTKIGLPAADNAGAGHWHIYVDGEYAGLSVSDVISLPNDALPSIPSGEHEVSVQLHNTDHTPVEPAATDAITVTFP